MKKLFLAVVTALLSVGFVGCSSSDDSEEILDTKKGVFKVEVIQEGDLNAYSISSVVTGGNGIDMSSPLIDCSTGKKSDISSYNLTDEEAKRSSYAYKTEKDGILILAAISYSKLTEESKPLQVSLKVFLNDKLLGEKNEIVDGTKALQISSDTYKY